jgi:uncharacterized protein YjiS (DUF1127 family)
MRAEVLTDLLAKLGECDADEGAKAAFRELIHSVCKAHGTDANAYDERTQFARHLLDLREPRATIRDRLMSHFGVSRTQAYRDIETALKVVPKNWDGRML